MEPTFLRDPALLAVLAALPEARVVGGAVRDALAGGAVADIDLATPARPDAVVAALVGAGLRAVPTGIAHGTVTAVSGGRGFEVTTLRRDVATDGRHATVAFTDNWETDAGRRDFTINAMSMTADGAVFDYFDGVADLRARRVRFIGNAAARLAEDWLRALRFFRFYARYAGEAPDGATVAALRDAARQMGRLSAERVWGELKRILAAPDPRGAVALMDRLGLLRAVLPEAGELAKLDRLVGDGAPTDPLLRLVALLRREAGNPGPRLRAAAAETQRIEDLCGVSPRAGDDDAALRLALEATPAEVLIARAWLAGAPATLRERLAALPQPVFPVEGRDLLALGYVPGPEIGVMLARLRQWWRDGGCVADRGACLGALGEKGRQARPGALPLDPAGV